MDYDFPRRFGVHNDFKQEVKIWGPIYLVDALIVIMALMIVVYCNRFFWDCKSVIPHIIFTIDILALSFYAIGRPRTNPGKRNIELFILTFTPTQRYFQSISVYNYVSMNNIFDTSGAVKRLPFNKEAALRGYSSDTDTDDE